jgi:adenosylhomocysteine nucleosidase
MLLRTLVHQFVRKAAEEKIREEVARRGGASNAKAEDGQTGESPPTPLPPCEIALVFAMGIESGGTVDLLDSKVATRCHTFLEHAGRINERDIIIAETGVGCAKAASATADLLKIFEPKWVVSAGFAGALREDLRRGNVVMPNRVTDVDGNELEVDFKVDPAIVEATKGLHAGRLVTVDHLIDTPEEKEQLGQQHDAIACDMETFAVAQACKQASVRFVSVRVISDTLSDRLPPELGSLLKQPSLAGRLGAATGAVFKRPASVKDMWKLRSTATKASETLAKFLAGLIPQLNIEDSS